jgi:CheY-like chemotaxis protein
MALRLLIVDDNRDSADCLAMLLRHSGFDVRTAYCGQQALEVTERFHPDVFIVDLAMPLMDGFQLAKQIREMPDFERALFVALSGHSEQTYLDEASKVQFDEYLVKPPKIELLLTILAEAPQRIGR